MSTMNPIHLSVLLDKFLQLHISITIKIIEHSIPYKVPVPFIIHLSSSTWQPRDLLFVGIDGFAFFFFRKGFAFYINGITKYVFF